MGRSLKNNIARMTGQMTGLDKKLLKIKHSWDDVNKLLESTDKRKKPGKK
ncbi:hypothetical protein [Anaerolentibacter hominis]